ncbi:helix-turn-helix domain-containing protein [Pontibacter litorisediminis]|uniref:helix-turn-helix domain-containing protein n=1 Tax=Pontibacter litorisediminis TaxID=1846260 RepID=UPI0023EC9B94|nr:helix-turn-helix transcriptional regulator [Pontibacter litorisediminis]
MIGNRIRTLREENKILLRQLAALLDMDTAMLSKMERGERYFKKEDIIRLSAFFKQPQEELLTLWLADKVVKTVAGENYKVEALTAAIACVEDIKNRYVR